MECFLKHSPIFKPPEFSLIYRLTLLFAEYMCRNNLIWFSVNNYIFFREYFIVIKHGVFLFYCQCGADYTQNFTSVYSYTKDTLRGSWFNNFAKSSCNKENLCNSRKFLFNFF